MRVDWRGERNRKKRWRETGGQWPWAFCNNGGAVVRLLWSLSSPSSNTTLLYHFRTHPLPHLLDTNTVSRAHQANLGPYSQRRSTSYYQVASFLLWKHHFRGLITSSADDISSTSNWTSRPQGFRPLFSHLDFFVRLIMCPCQH